MKQLAAELRQLSINYNRCMRSKRQMEAMTYLPEIKEKCQQLGMDWKVFTGLEAGYIFIGDSQGVEKKVESTQDSTVIQQPIQQLNKNGQINSIEHFQAFNKASTMIQHVESDVEFTQSLRKCLYCDKPLPPGSKKNFCSNSHNTMHLRKSK